MKQRITYLVPNSDDFNPDLLNVKHESLEIKGLKAAKEHRITVGLSELPLDLRTALEQWHELHIRWASSKPYTGIPPFTSRVSSGLHVFFTPQKDQSTGNPCLLLKNAFGQDLKCENVEKSFTKPPILSGRFSMSATHQYYAYVPTLSKLISYIGNEICAPGPNNACKAAAMSLSSASYLDIDYDAISHAVILNAFWDGVPNGQGWTETITLPGREETIEVGVLNHEPNPDPEDIAFSGFLTILGQDEKPKPTRFQTPARHYPLFSSQPQLTYNTFFSRPTGLHPTLLITLPTASLTPPEKTCRLHSYLTLPSYLFIDKYQFTDALFLSSHNLKSLRSISGATDLEAPDWVVSEWGSGSLFELEIPSSTQQGEAGSKSNEMWEISIPVHLRYLPASETSHTSVPVPWPALFWACRAEEGTKMNVNPFDRTHLGYEGLFGPKTRFMHIPPTQEGSNTTAPTYTCVTPESEGGRVCGGERGRLVEWINVPILDLRKSGWVETGTVGVVVTAFLFLSWMLFRPGSTKKSEKNVRTGKKKQ